MKTLNRAKEEIVGKTPREADIPVVSTPEALSVIESLEREQIITDLRYRNDGQDLFFQMQVIPTTFDDGEKGCTLVLEDITERKKYVPGYGVAGKDSDGTGRYASKSRYLPVISLSESLKLSRKPGCMSSRTDEEHTQFCIRAFAVQNFTKDSSHCWGGIPLAWFCQRPRSSRHHFRSLSAIFSRHVNL